jgi:hypothetical protein
VSWVPFHQRLFDATPLLNLVGLIRDCNLVGNILDSDTNQGREDWWLVAALDLLRTGFHGQLLASNHDQARSIRTSFGTVETRYRLASPASSRDKVSRSRKLCTCTILDSWLRSLGRFIDHLNGSSPGADIGYQSDLKRFSFLDTNRRPDFWFGSSHGKQTILWHQPKS